MNRLIHQDTTSILIYDINVISNYMYIDTNFNCEGWFDRHSDALTDLQYVPVPLPHIPQHKIWKNQFILHKQHNYKKLTYHIAVLDIM